MSAVVKLSSKIDALAADLTDEPKTVRIGVIWFDTARVVVDTDTGEHVPTIRVRCPATLKPTGLATRGRRMTAEEARAAAEDKMGDLAAYVGTLTAEEALGELLHITRKATSMPVEAMVGVAPMLIPITSLVLERFVSQCPTKATIPEEQTLHSCTLLLRAHVAARQALAPDGGAGS